MSQLMNRRNFLKLTGLAGAGWVLVSCTPPTAAPKEEAPKEEAPESAVKPETQGKSAKGYIESPMLAERVKAGTLPPIDERLPEKVFVVGPGVLHHEEYMDWEDGKLGGTMNIMAMFAAGPLHLGCGGTVLRSPSQSTAESVPNVVEAFSYSEDLTTFNFTIRKGMKWSDGVPVTTEDVRFTIEDMYMDPEVNRAWPVQLFTQSNSNLGHAELETIDDFSFELKFGQPYGYFIAELNSWIPGSEILIKPSHYLKKFHKKYAKPEDLEAELKKNNQDNWAQMLNVMDVSHWGVGDFAGLGKPTLYTWILTEANEERRVFERNPYYYHVDGLGQQLPYIDKIVLDLVVDNDALVNATLAGQQHLAAETEAPLNKLAIFTQNADRAGYRIFMTGGFVNPLHLNINHDYMWEEPESGWQKLVSDPEQRFGKALAAAIDTKGISDTVFYGLFSVPVPGTDAHDPELAKQLLDQAGMDKMGDDGFRLGPDGKPLVFRITYTAANGEFDPVAELLKEQFDAVGIHTELENTGTNWTTWSQKANANELMATIHWNDGPAWSTGISEDYTPIQKGMWAPMTWKYYVTKGENGRKPPDYIQKFYDLHANRKKFAPESPEGKQAYADLMNWFDTYYVMFPTSGLKVQANIVNKKLRNTQKEGAPFELDTDINAEALWFAE